MRELFSMCCRALVAALLAAVLACPLVLAQRSTPAGAIPLNFGANMLGYNNIDGYGNRGDLASVNNLTDTIAFLINSGGDIPAVVATQEICWGVFGGDPTSQFNILYSRLAFISGNTVAYGFGVEDVTNHVAEHCVIHGNGVIARANSPTAKWAGDDYLVFTQNDPNHVRNQICIRPTVWVVNVAACSLHLSRSNGVQQNEASEGWVRYAGIGTGQKWWAGDFNYPAGNTYWSWTPDAGPTANTYSSEELFPSKYVDFIFYSNLTKHAIAQLWLPAVCSTLCSGLGLKRTSDHKWVVGYVF
jgi:hypothetical protein